MFSSKCVNLEKHAPNGHSSEAFPKINLSTCVPREGERENKKKTFESCMRILFFVSLKFFIINFSLKISPCIVRILQTYITFL